MASNKPEPKLYLDWNDLEYWFKKTYPKEYKSEKVRDWLVGRDGVANGSLLTADGECLSPEFDPSDYGKGTDWEAVKFFMRTIEAEFPKAVNDYGDVKIYFSW